MDKIFVQIASYRDSELVKTIDDCINKCSDPDRLTFGIAWQHNPADTFDRDLEKYLTDPRVTVADISWYRSRGPCWARSLIQQMYQGETYTLQIDSHHRFAQNWDRFLINCLKVTGSHKPMMTGYPRPYFASNESIPLDSAPQVMRAIELADSGHARLIGDNVTAIHQPVRSRFISAGFIFTLGSFCQECPYDPNLYFEGEEITLSLRAYTLGYDFYHPHVNVIWHDYATYERSKHWSDHTLDKVEKPWHVFDVASKQRVRQLLRIEDSGIDLGKYGLGHVRSYEEYEAYAGVDFKTKRFHPHALKWQEPPTLIVNDKGWLNAS